MADEKKVDVPGLTSSAFLATAPLSATLVAAALAQPGLSDGVRIAALVIAGVVQVGYVLGNALVKWGN